MTMIKTGKPIDAQSREIVFNVYRYFQNEADKFKCHNESYYFEKIQERVAQATGVSRRTLNRIFNEEKERQTPSTSVKPSCPKKGNPKKEIHLDPNSFEYEAIKKMIYDFHSTFHEFPTINLLKAKLVEAIAFKGSEKTLRKILRQMGFQFTKMEHDRKIMIEEHDVKLKQEFVTV